MDTVKSMNKVKLPAVAGKFYPSDATELRHMIETFLADSPYSRVPQPKAIIAPHAGYIFSGPIAGNAYRVLSGMTQIKQVILIGPSHYVYVEGAALSSSAFFQTPLGQVPVSQEFNQALLKLPQVEILDEAFQQEHSIEVQIPFLQVLLPGVSIVPILVGRSDQSVVANIIELFWEREDTLFIISTDLSHYHDYATAVNIDQKTMRSILLLDANSIAPEQACGCFAVKGLLDVAKKYHMESKLLDLRNSGDTQEDKNRVVGYSAVHFYPSESVFDKLTASEEIILLTIANESIKYGLQHHKPGVVMVSKLPAIFHHRCATFVTIYINNQLRGCIGSLEPRYSVAEDVMRNAFASAFKDPRFPPLNVNEFKDIKLEISLLGPLQPMQFESEENLIAQLQPGKDGILLADAKYRAVFLPLVWEKLPDPKSFIQALKQKAGMPADYWSNSMQAWRFFTRTIE